MTLILIIEDDAATREVMSRALRIEGYEVCVAKDGGEGVAVWEARRPDATITDLHMPNVDGIETIMALRGRDRDVRIVAVSGGDTRSSFLALDSASDLGAMIVLPKPFSPAQLVAAVRTVLRPADG